MSNVTPIRRDSEGRSRQLSIRARMVLGFISEAEYWLAIKRADGGSVIAFTRSQCQRKERQS